MSFSCVPAGNEGCGQTPPLQKLDLFERPGALAGVGVFKTIYVQPLPTKPVAVGDLGFSGSVGEIPLFSMLLINW